MSQIEKLVAAVSANAAILEEELLRSGFPEPNDDPMSSLEFPNVGTKGAKARVALLSAIHQLDRVVQSPVEYFRNFSQSCIETGCIRTLIGFNIPGMIPIDGRLTYDELSELSGLTPKVLRTLVRAAVVSAGFLHEDEHGRVGHTVSSAIFHPDRGQQDRSVALKWQTYSMLNCGANLEKALRVDPLAQDDHASAFAIAHCGPDGKALNFWEYLEQNPQMGRWFHAAMRIVTQYPMRSTDHLVNGYDWATLHCKTVVEIGGSTGQICAEIAKKNPCIKFIAQDLAEVVEEGRAIAGLRPNVSLEVSSFFNVQPRVADAYLIRTIFHDWSDSHCQSIIKNLVPALRHGSRVIAEEILLPEHKTIPGFSERNFRRADLIMTALFNGRERSLEEYIELVKGVDDRLLFQKRFHPPGSITSIMEWIFVDPENKNGQLQKAKTDPVAEKIEAPALQDLEESTVTVLPDGAPSGIPPLPSNPIVLFADGNESLKSMMAVKKGAHIVETVTEINVESP